MCGRWEFYFQKNVSVSVGLRKKYRTLVIIIFYGTCRVVLQDSQPVLANFRPIGTFHGERERTCEHYQTIIELSNSDNTAPRSPEESSNLEIQSTSLGIGLQIMN